MKFMSIEITDFINDTRNEKLNVKIKINTDVN